MLRTRPSKAEQGMAANSDMALIAITLDVEMSIHYPKRGMMEWNYDKGNLNDETKAYTREACRRVKDKGGVLHAFILGRTFEQPGCQWLKQIVAEGHRVSNHTYDHVKVTARNTRELQYRFRRAPWLIQGKTARDVIAENIRLTASAMKHCLGVESVGLRTPYGSPVGLTDRPDVQKLLLELGIQWVSSQAVDHVIEVARSNPTAKDYAKIVRAQKDSQPFVYPSGLIEIPLSPMGDVFTLRERRWNLREWLSMIEKNLAWAIDNHAVYDFFAHPSILYVEDPEFRAIELICDMVAQSGGKAAIVGLDIVAERVRLRGG